MGKDKTKKGGEAGSSASGEAAAASPEVKMTTKFAVLGLADETQKILKPAAAAGGAASSSSSAAAAGGAQGRRAKAGKGPKIAAGLQKIGGDSYPGRQPDPAWLQDRVAVYDQVKQRRAAELAAKTPVDITVTMPDGKVIEKDKPGHPLQAWKSTPYDVAVVISQGLADASTVARVTYASFVDDYSLQEDGMEGEDMLSDAMADGGVEQEQQQEKTVLLWDMMRPFVGPVAKLELLKFEGDTDAKTVFWHSSAHMMGEALEHLYGSKLTIGPPLAGGFYYDSYMGSETLKEDDCKCSDHCGFFDFVRSVVACVDVERAVP